MESLPVICGLVAFIVYCNTLTADFAYDDHRAIRTNRDLLPTTPWRSLLLDDYWGTQLSDPSSHQSYRPLTVATFRLNYQLHQLQPAGYHCTNVLLHCVASALFARLAAARLGGARSAASRVAALLFAVHPVHCEAVAGVVGRADLLAALFYLASFFAYGAYLRWRDSLASSSVVGVANGFYGKSRPLSSVNLRVMLRSLRRWRHLLLCFSCAACAMLSKEHGVTVLGVCLVYDLFIYNRLYAKDVQQLIVKRKYRPRLEGACCLVIMLAVLVAARLLLSGTVAPHFSPSDNPAAACASWSTRLRTFLYLPLFCGWLLLCPTTLSFDWSMEAVPLLSSWFDRRCVALLAVYGALLAVSVRAVSGWLRPVLTHNCSRSDSVSETLSQSPATPLAYSTNGFPVTSNGKLCSHHHSHRHRNHHHHHTYIINNNHHDHHYNHPHHHHHHHHSLHCCSCYTSVNKTLTASSAVSVLDSDTSSQSEDTAPMKSRPRELWDPSSTTLLSVTLMVVPFLPASNLFFYVGFVIAERVLYIPSFGFCLLIGCGYGVLIGRSSRSWRHLLNAAATATLVAMATRTMLRNADWHTEERLYRSGIAVNPAKAYGNLANILSSSNRTELAEVAYKRALAHRPNMADVHYNLGILYQEQMKLQQALQCYDRAIHYRPRMTMAYLNRGLALALLGRRAEAAAAYRRCAQLPWSGLRDPAAHQVARVSALFNLGRLAADSGDAAGAVETYLSAVRQMPPHYQPQSLYNMLGEAYLQLGRRRQSEHWYRKSLQASPDHLPAHLTYAKLLATLGRKAEAERLYARAIRLAPDQTVVYQHYAQYLVESDRLGEAAAVYRRAAELAPLDHATIFGAATVLRQLDQRQAAEAMYRRAVHLKPDDAVGHMNLGAMLHVNGKLHEAEQCYQNALRLRPDDQITRANLDKLRQLSSSS